MSELNSFGAAHVKATPLASPTKIEVIKNEENNFSHNDGGNDFDVYNYPSESCSLSGCTTSSISSNKYSCDK